MTDTAPLKGLRILLVEDEMMVAMLIEDFLEDFGCTIVGPAATVAAALLLSATEAIDGALLDMNLEGEAIYPVADELARLEIPFIFVTGYFDLKLRRGYTDRPMLPKPFGSQDLEKIMTTTFMRISERGK